MPAEGFRFPNLLSAKVYAQKMVGVAYKEGSNPSQHYPYASKEEIARVAKDALAEAGLSFELRGPVEASDNGWVHFVARLDWEGGSFDEWDVFWDGNGERGSGASRLGSVMSYAFKNALLNCLNIPRETKESAENRVDDGDNGATSPWTSGRSAPAAPQEAPPQPEADALRGLLKERLNCDRDSSDAVIQLVTEVDGVPRYGGWAEACKDPGGCAQVTGAIQDFLTTLNPEELVRNATLRSQERAQP